MSDSLCPHSQVARGLCCAPGQRRVIAQHSKEPIHPDCPLSLQHRQPLTPQKGSVSLASATTLCSLQHSLAFFKCHLSTRPHLHSGLEHIDRSVFFLVSLGTFSHYQVLAIESNFRNRLLSSLVPWLVSHPCYFGAPGPVVGVLLLSAARF